MTVNPPLTAKEAYKVVRMTNRMLDERKFPSPAQMEMTQRALQAICLEKGMYPSPFFK